jgi:hypothetical protein
MSQKRRARVVVSWKAILNRALVACLLLEFGCQTSKAHLVTYSSGSASLTAGDSKVFFLVFFLVFFVIIVVGISRRQPEDGWRGRIDPREQAFWPWRADHFILHRCLLRANRQIGSLFLAREQ